VKADLGTACAAPGAASCSEDEECEGALCAEGTCRSACSSGQDCLADQLCAQGSCVGTDPRHDPTASLSSGGAGGSGASVGGSAGSSGLAGGPARECETSEARCNSRDERETCTTDGTWGVGVTCPFACIADDCGGKCIPNTKDCLLGKTPRVCNDQGEWVAAADCPAVCVEGSCEASCEVGSKQCSGKAVLVCGAAGTFAVDETCDYLCDEASKRCAGECEPTTQRCAEADLQSCGADASWQTLASCPAVCTPKVDMVGQFECSGLCSPTSRRCENSSNLQVCKASGTYADTNCAASGKTCYEVNGVADCNGSCAPGEKRCQGNKVQTCGAAGVLEDAQTCTNQACVEASGSASCTGNCAPGQQQCAANRVQNCDSSGTYVNAPGTCTNQTCLKSGTTAACGGMCAPTQTSCASNNAQTCSSSGTWALADDCAAPTEICRTGACVANDPYQVGESSAAGWEAYDPPDDLWHLVRIVAPRSASVVALRLIGRAGGGLARMALWQEAAGKPGAFVAQTDNISLSAGIGGDAPVPLSAKVSGGQAYWIGAKFSNTAAIFSKSQSGLTGYMFDQPFSANPSTTLSPFPSASASEFTGVALNFYLLVQDESL